MAATRGQRRRVPLPGSVTEPPVSVEEIGGAASTQRPVTRAGYDAVGNQVDAADARANATKTTCTTTS